MSEVFVNLKCCSMNGKLDEIFTRSGSCCKLDKSKS